MTEFIIKKPTRVLILSKTNVSTNQPTNHNDLCVLYQIHTWQWIIFMTFLLFSVYGLLYSSLLSFHNILAYASFSLLQVLDVEFGSLHGTSNRTLYLIYGVDCFNSVKLNPVQVLSYSKYSLLFTYIEDWTCNGYRRLIKELPSEHHLEVRIH